MQEAMNDLSVTGMLSSLQGVALHSPKQGLSNPRRCYLNLNGLPVESLPLHKDLHGIQETEAADALAVFWSPKSPSDSDPMQGTGCLQPVWKGRSVEAASQVDMTITKALGSQPSFFARYLRLYSERTDTRCMQTRAHGLHITHHTHIA